MNEEKTCIDLRPWAQANHYRFRMEESYKAEEPKYRGDGRWYVEIPCRYGLIYPFGGETLLAYATRGVKRHIAVLPGTSHHQYDDDAEVFRFPVSQLDAVAAILRPRKRRMYSPEVLAVKRELLRLARERKKSLTGSGQNKRHATQKRDEADRA